MKANIPNMPAYDLTSVTGGKEVIEPDLEKSILEMREFEPDEWAKNEMQIAIERLKKEARAEDDEARRKGLNVQHSVTQFTYDRLAAGYDLYNFSRSMGPAGTSGFTKSVFNRLYQRMPLTPLTNNDDDWISCKTAGDEENSEQSFMHKRYGYLFKYIDKDGNVTYSDVARARGIEGNRVYRLAFLTDLLDEMPEFKITFPYFPEDEPYRFYTESFMTQEDHKTIMDYKRRSKNYDTIAIAVLMAPKGRCVPVNRYFKYDLEKGHIEIGRDEFQLRRESWICKMDKKMKTIAEMEKKKAENKED